MIKLPPVAVSAGVNAMPPKVIVTVEPEIKPEPVTVTGPDALAPDVGDSVTVAAAVVTVNVVGYALNPLRLPPPLTR